jgi:inositol phosphorylceramide mannosyltransferase catalytic subunit
MIPKRIICTHISQHTLHPKLKHCIDLMQSLHPSWEFLFFSDGDCEDFVRKECPAYLELYQWYPRPVLKADLFRLLAVWKLGGFYLDTDFLLNAPLDPLCEHKAVFAYEHETDIHEMDLRYPHWMRTREETLTLANYAFGAEAGHPFVLAILHELIARTRTLEVEHVNDLDVLHATGPDAVTTVYYREQERWDDVVLLKAPRAGLGHYGIHLVHGSWRQY